MFRFSESHMGRPNTREHQHLKLVPEKEAAKERASTHYRDKGFQQYQARLIGGPEQTLPPE